ncbi:MAG: MFS transporter [Actinomycetota bacterium]|nr:MAG: MFS transporter [Actinomycetota bacterium]
MSVQSGASPVRYRDVLAHREFRGIVAAQVASESGDQVARVALALLVLDRTGSALGAAAAFAVGAVPAVFGGSLLGPLADRLSRRGVMLVADAARALIVAFMALTVVTGVPLWVPFAILFVAELFTAPFDAARTATVPDVLPAHQIAAGMGMTRSLTLINQIIGLALGAVVVNLLGSQVALALDAVSFAASFLILSLTLKPRPAALVGEPSLLVLLSDLREGAVLLARDRSRRSVVLLACLMAWPLVAPEAAALAYARDQGVGDEWGGALMAISLAGAAVGSVLIGRQRPLVQLDLVFPFAVACTLPMLATAGSPTVAVTALLWCAAGVLSAFVVSLMAFTNILTPPSQRGRVAGIAGAGFTLTSALGFLLTGWIADLTSPAFAVVVGGVVGLLALGLMVRLWPGHELRSRLRALDEM